MEKFLLPIFIFLDTLFRFSFSCAFIMKGKNLLHQNNGRVFDAFNLWKMKEIIVFGESIFVIRIRWM